jgi:hypothetical protein
MSIIQWGGLSQPNLRGSVGRLESKYENAIALELSGVFS